MFFKSKLLSHKGLMKCVFVYEVFFHFRFIQSLVELIQNKFPTNPFPENVSYSQEDSDIVHIQFQDLHTLVEFVPLVLAYVILFLYIYFSVCKSIFY